MYNLEFLRVVFLALCSSFYYNADDISSFADTPSLATRQIVADNLTVDSRGELSDSPRK